MITESDFNNLIVPEITGRLARSASPQDLDDWYHFLKYQSVTTAKENIVSFFRGFDGPKKPAEFNRWIINKGFVPENTAVDRFDGEFLKYPEHSMVLIRQRDREWHGFVERQDFGDRGCLLCRNYQKKWMTRWFTPSAVRKTNTEIINLKKPAPKSWTMRNVWHEGTPEGLMDLVETKWDVIPPEEPLDQKPAAPLTEVISKVVDDLDDIPF